MEIPAKIGREKLAPLRWIHSAELGRLEGWVTKNSTWLALATIASAFALRFAYCDLCYLNPDEAQHFYAAAQSSWLETYKAAFTLAHPPLFILVLHGVLFLGRTELILRLPSLVGGTTALWLTFAWIRRSLGEVPALAGLVFMALSPAAISSSTEVRQYGLLLCSVCGALYATERTFTARSTLWAIVQELFLVCALLTHYTAIVVIISLGSFVLLRSLFDTVPHRVLFTFCMSQLVLATLLGWLYFGHVRGKIPFGAGSSMDYLRPYFYARQNETWFTFTWRALSGTFSYAGSHRSAFLFMLVFIAGVGGIATGRTRARRLQALLLISPFIAGFAAAVFQVFPFAGSRHQTYLLPFLAAGVSAFAACAPRGWAVPLLMAGVVIAPLWVTHARPDNDPRTTPLSDMTAAIEYVKATVPQGTPLFVDYETRDELRYYLTRNDTNLDTVRFNAGVEERLGGYRVVVPRGYVWSFRSNEVLKQVTESARALGVPGGDPLWVVSTSWTEPPLASRPPAGGDRQVKEFGRISVIKVLSQEH